MELVKKTDYISTLVKTEKVYGPHVRHGYRVTWIYWDSAFRQTDLQIGDLIVGVDGVAYQDIANANVSGNAVGQYGESSHWKKAEKKDGDIITLNVFRDEKELQIQGELRVVPMYFTPEGKNSMFPGGPYRLAKDGFQTAWVQWYEDLIKKESYILDAGWERGSFNNQREMAKHLEHRDRVKYLLEKYPGEFAETIKKDWDKVFENLQGRRYELSEEGLEYRALGEKRVQIAKAAAKQAWEQTCQAESQKERNVFPVPDIDKAEADIGKVVVLPWVTPRQLINRLGKSFLIIGSHSTGFYFMDLNTELGWHFFECYYRFRSQVNPNMTEKYRFVAKILDKPLMLSYQRRTAIGLMVAPVAGLAGNEEMFVDLRGQTPILFAGEQELKSLVKIELTDDMPPEKVVETMILAVQQANQETWQKVFADWRVWVRNNGEVYLNPSYHVGKPVYMRAWETSRRLVMNEVYDVQVQRVGPVNTLAEEDQELQNPKIQQVTLFVDHIGKSEQDYRAFVNVKVHREWTLQRLGDGPWRIMEVNSI